MANDAQASLMTQGGPNSGATISLSGRPLTMGRRPDNDVMDDHTTVSRRHALIMVTPGGYVLRDLNTTNGTFINREKVGVGEFTLKHGDRIRLAGSEITFVFREEGSDTQEMRAEPPSTGAIRLDEVRHLVQPSAEPQPGGKEAELLRFLESKQGNPVGRDEIARAMWPELPPGTEANDEIERAIEQLRTQIEDDPSNPVHLLTVGEFGFILI